MSTGSNNHVEKAPDATTMTTTQKPYVISRKEKSSKLSHEESNHSHDCGLNLPLLFCLESI